MTGISGNAHGFFCGSEVSPFCSLFSCTREQYEQSEQREQYEQREQSEQSEQSEQREQREQREQYEQREQSEQYEQREQREQSEQSEQSEQYEQREQLVQFSQFFRLANASRAFSSVPQYSTEHRLPFSSVIQVGPCVVSAVISVSPFWFRLYVFGSSRFVPPFGLPTVRCNALSFGYRCGQATATPVGCLWLRREYCEQTCGDISAQQLLPEVSRWN